MELGNSTSPSADYCLVYNYYTSLGSPSNCAVPAQGTGDNGDVISKYYQDNVTTSYSHTSTFTYDAVNRLLTAVATGNSSYNLTYSYDEYGNGTCVMNGSTGGLCPQYSYNEATNQISNTGYSYDAAGNLLYDGNENYTYDAEGRVISATNSGGTQTSMYNAISQRIEDVQPDGSSTMTLTYPRGILGHRLEIFDQRPSIGWTGADIWFARVAGQRIKMGGSTSWLLHANAVGSSTMQTDQTGAVDWDGDFYPFGQAWHSGTGEVSFADLGYPVNEPVLPSATRGYDQALGRWLTPDKLGGNILNPQSFNRYAYVTNNPASFNDPSGLSEIYIGGGIGGYCDPFFDGNCESLPPSGFFMPVIPPLRFPGGFGGGGGSIGGGGTAASAPPAGQPPLGGMGNANRWVSPTLTPPESYCAKYGIPGLGGLGDSNMPCFAILVVTSATFGGYLPTFGPNAVGGPIEPMPSSASSQPTTTLQFPPAPVVEFGVCTAANAGLLQSCLDGCATLSEVPEAAGACGVVCGYSYIHRENYCKRMSGVQ